MSKFPQRTLGYSQVLKNWINKQLKEKVVLAIWMRSPYLLNDLENMHDVNGLLIGYQDNDQAQEAMLAIINGEASPQGRLPVKINQQWPAGFGLNYQQNE